MILFLIVVGIILWCIINSFLHMTVTIEDENMSALIPYYAVATLGYGFILIYLLVNRGVLV